MCYTLWKRSPRPGLRLATARPGRRPGGFYMDDIIIIGPIRFNARQYQIERNGKTIGLSTLEARVLITLAAHANTACTLRQLSLEVYGIDDAGNMIKLFIRHLRHKIEPDPTSPTYIQTVPGVGYQLVI